MKLSPHFSLYEFTRSETATRLDIDNTPDDTVIANLRTICEKVLEPVRAHFKRPVRINSGYRSLALNKVLNPFTSVASNISKHCYGQAVDFEIDGVPNYEVALWCAENIPEFHQVILEFYTPGQPNSGWVHVSYVPGNQKMEVKTAHKVNGKTIYTPRLLA